MLELVVPTPDYNTALLAIKAGADAIYAPIKNMVNLRFKASFFDMKNLKRVISYAHQNNKKVYAVLNQTVTEERFIKFVEMIEYLTLINVDGIVLGDIGLIKYANNHFKKNIKIIASSVIGASNKFDVSFLEKLGANRVIIPRLVSGKSLENICSTSLSEIEIYVHGNLCPSWDGFECKLSDSFGYEKTGVCQIKGAIAPCLRQYKTEFSNENILWKNLVQYDIALIPYFNKIGITSVKVIPPNISNNYIKNVIKIWREAIDSYYRNPDEWIVKNEWIEAFQKESYLPLRMDLYYLGRNF